MEDILEAIPTRFTMSSYVHQREALYLFDGISNDDQKIRTPIDLTSVIAAGHLSIVESDLSRISGQILAFAAEGIGNGEAISGAMATDRNWAIGTDDRKAMNVFAQLVPHLQIINTFDLIRHWALARDVGEGTIREVLQKVQMRGRFVLWKDHPLYEWVDADS
jgi:hypothetical protein